jgi:hypothetical protein
MALVQFGLPAEGHECVSVQEAAQRLGLTVQQVMQLVSSRQLQCTGSQLTPEGNISYYVLLPEAVVRQDVPHTSALPTTPVTQVPAEQLPASPAQEGVQP